MDNTEQRILEAARALFSEHGLENVKMRDIAVACGISPGNLTYYFRKKEDLYAATYKESLRLALEKIQSASERLDLNHPWIRFIAIIYTHLCTVVADEKGLTGYIFSTRFPSARKTYISTSSELLFDCLKDTPYAKDRRSIYLASINGCGGEFEAINTYSDRREEYDFDEIIAPVFTTRMYLLGVPPADIRQIVSLGMENGKALSAAQKK